MTSLLQYYSFFLEKTRNRNLVIVSNWGMHSSDISTSQRIRVGWQRPALQCIPPNCVIDVYLHPLHQPGYVQLRCLELKESELADTGPLSNVSRLTVHIQTRSSMPTYTLHVKIAPNQVQDMLEDNYKLCIAKMVGESYSVVWSANSKYQTNNTFKWTEQYQVFATDGYWVRSLSYSPAVVYR